MGKFLNVAVSLEFSKWIRGLLSAGISAGASAASSAVILPSLDSVHFAFFTSKWWMGMAAFFGTSALTSILKFLNAQPLPEEVKTVVTTVETVKKQSPSTVVTSTVQETHVVPVAAPTPPVPVPSPTNPPVSPL